MINLIGKPPAPLPAYDQAEQVEPAGLEPPATPATPGPKPRMVVELPNFHETELDCSDGCGKKTDPMLAIALQAFIGILARDRGRPVRVIVKGGARCEKNQRRIYQTEVPPAQRIKPTDPTPTSYHLGADRRDIPGKPGAAVDCRFEEKTNDTWSRVPNPIVMKLAKLSGLFGGIGNYSWGVHLDCRLGLSMWQS